MSVVFSRAPLRISLGGGGTDLPSYYSDHGGFLIAGAIDKYVYMLIHTVFQRQYRMKYSESEEVETIAEIRHPILRETLSRHWRGNPLEIAIVADVPAGTGMGSLGDAGCHRRGGQRDRDRGAQGELRQTGHLRRRSRRDLRVHVQR
jgi:D-glycero-alpha-D-manno-heptose-7-phosphate kinase